MSDRSKIEWTDATWSPVTGCTPVSEGCANCYARRMAHRLRGRFGYPADEPFRVTLHPERLEEPFRWRKPRRVFVCSMGDLFHEDVPGEFIRKVFGYMHHCKRHTFMVLTKRPERMADFIRWYSDWVGFNAWPREYSHAWLGVSCENQRAADERIPILLQIPAAVRFVSVEPMLGPVALTEIKLPLQYNITRTTPAYINALDRNDDDHYWNVHNALDWVICGGETGPGARPMHPDWPRKLRDDCQAAGVPFFLKHRGEWIECQEAIGRIRPEGLRGEIHVFEDGTEMIRVGKKAAGRLLDGRTWDETPEVK